VNNGLENIDNDINNKVICMNKYIITIVVIQYVNNGLENMNNEGTCMNKYIIIIIVTQYVNNGLENMNNGLKVYG
jgi:hypothetical protein